MRFTRRIRMRAGFGFAILVCLLLLPHAHASAKPSFVVKPEPAWVRPIEINRDAGPRDRPTTALLDDRETKLSANGVERFYRYSERVNTTAGLEKLSQLQFNFEPSYQSLAIHFIRIIRGGQTRNALEPSAIKIVANEEDLDEQIYNGTLTAVVFLKDVRAGDVVEYAYTVSGDNPVFAGRFSDRFYLADGEPIQSLRVRLLAPPDRPLYLRNHDTDLVARESSDGTDKEYLWERSEVPAIEPEDSTPSWFNPVPSVVVSEFADWQGVVQWAAPYYLSDHPLPPELKSKAEGWLKQLPTPEERMIAALRFVQQEIRYLGIELGPYSHRPSPPSQTYARRFGDCKDKSFLLDAVLKFMSIDSATALVNTSAGHTLDDYQPSPEAFDHVIVQVKIGGRTFWLDPTIESQRGNVGAYYDPSYERALVLRPETRALEQIPQPKLEKPTTEVEEFYDVESNSDRVSLRVTTTARDSDADELRYRWSQRSAKETGRLYLNYYADNNPSITADGSPTIKDNEEENVVTVEEKYSIGSFWKNNFHYFNGDLTYGELPRPGISQRSMPLALHHPIFITQTIHVSSMSIADLTPRSEVIANDAFRFDSNYQPATGSVRMTYSLRTFSDHIEPKQMSAYLSQADQIWNSTGVQLPKGYGVITRTSNAQTNFGMAMLLIMLSVFVAIGVVVIIRVRRDRRTPFLQKPQAGASPETAMRCKDSSDLEAAAMRFKCRCGTNAFDPDELAHQETLYYDGERLGTIKVKCKGCGHTSDLYFVQPPAMANA